MKNLKPVALGTGAFFYSFLSLSVALADDTEIYVPKAVPADQYVRPNILFILDSSGSMGSEVAGTNPKRTRNQVLQTVVNDLIDQIKVKEDVNVGFMQVMNQRHIRLRVYERGVGETQACGTGACAAVAVGIREGWLDEGEDIRAQLYGGSMVVRWQPGYSVMMTGPTAFVYEGVFSPDGLMAQAGIKPNPS